MLHKNAQIYSNKNISAAFFFFRVDNFREKCFLRNKKIVSKI